MIGLYLSGTGNTRHCIEYLLRLLDETAEAAPIEDENAAERVSGHFSIILAYPIQYSNAPLMVREFIRDHAEIWRGKRVLCLATMGAFSGDGAGCAARLLKKYGAAVTGGLHLRMPDSVCDSRLLKKPLAENRETVKAAERKIEAAAGRIRAGDFPKDGLGFFFHIAGLLGQHRHSGREAPSRRPLHPMLPLRQPLPAESHHPSRGNGCGTVPYRKLPVM